MKIVGCDPHARQQSIAMLDTETGELVEKILLHEGNVVRQFYAALEGVENEPSSYDGHMEIVAAWGGGVLLPEPVP